MAPYAQVFLRKLEAVGRAQHRLEPGLAVLGEGLGIDEEAVGLLLAATHAAPELVEGREAEALRVLHDHRGRVGHVDAHLHDARGHEDADPALREGLHRLPLLVFLQPRMDEAHLVARIDLPRQALVHLLGVLELCVRRGRRPARDEGIDEIGLPARLEEAPDVVVDLGLVARPGKVGLYGLATRGHGPDGRDREVAEDREREGAGDGRGGHHEEVGEVALAAQGQALQHAEAVLLVHDREAEVAVLDLVREEGMGAKDEVHLAGLEGSEEGRAGRVLDVAREEGEPHAEWLEEAGRRLRVLAREKLGRRHHGRLAARLDGLEAGQEGDKGLARAHVSLEEAAHGVGPGHVGHYLGGGLLLVGREAEGKALEEPAAQEPLGGVARYGVALPRESAPRHRHLEVEELLVDEALSRLRQGRGRGRLVELGKGPALVGHAPPRDDRGRYLVLDMGAEVAQGLPHELAEGALLEAFGGRVERDEALGRGGPARQHLGLEGGGLELSAAELELAGDDGAGADREDLLQEGPVEAKEGRDGRSLSLVPDEDLEGPHAAVAEPFVREDLDHRMGAACLDGIREGNEDRAVIVVAGIVEEEVGHRVDAEAGQPRLHLGPRAAEYGHGLV